MSRWFRAMTGGLLLCLLFTFFGFAGNCEGIRRAVVRVHILANSNSQEDQALKLKVRDAVTEAGAGLLDGVTDASAAQKRLETVLPQLRDTAQRCVYENGYTYPVTVRQVRMYFATRTYEAGTFPAGWYDAVRFTIGEGNGKNWWCLMYPPLCVSAATDKDTLDEVLSGEQDAIVEHAERYTVRFKVVEWLETLRGVLRLGESKNKC